MFNKSQIMKSAWAIYREAYGFARVAPDRFRVCFVWALKVAWQRAKQAARIASIPLADRQARAERIRDQIDALKFKSLRYDIAAMRRNLERELASLAV